MGDMTAYIVLQNNAEKDRGLYVNFSDNPPCIFGGSGVVFGEDGLCAIPHFPHEAVCPFCRSEIYKSLEDGLSESCEVSEDFSVQCQNCGKAIGINDVNSGNTNWYIAKNYIYISEIDQDEWDEVGLANKIRKTLPGVVGIVLGYEA